MLDIGHRGLVFFFVHNKMFSIFHMAGYYKTSGHTAASAQNVKKAGRQLQPRVPMV